MEKRIKEQKERETAKLREKQEQASDKQGELDAVRMRKAFELAEKEAKNREKLAEEKRQKLLNDLDAARTVQFKNKEDRLAQEAREERDNYLYVIQC